MCVYVYVWPTDLFYLVLASSDVTDEIQVQRRNTIRKLYIKYGWIMNRLNRSAVFHASKDLPRLPFITLSQFTCKISRVRRTTARETSQVAIRSYP